MTETLIHVCFSDKPVNHKKLLQSFQEMQIAYMEAVIFNEELSECEMECMIQQMRERLCGTEK